MCLSKYFFFLALGLISINLKAQHVSFSGAIKDSATNETLPFVNIYLYSKADTLKTVTGLDGDFIFQKIDSGTYKLKIKFVGYLKIDSAINLANNIADFEVKLISAPIDTLWAYRSFGVNKEKANRDIKNGFLYLYLPGGIVGSPELKGDKKFQEK